MAGSPTRAQSPTTSSENNDLSIKRKRAFQWRDDEVKALLLIWEEKLDDLRKFKRNKHVYEEMSKALKNTGVRRSHMEISVKVSNLTKEFRRERSKVSSGGTPSTWKFYNEINEIIGLPRNNSVLQDESYNESLNNDENQDSGMVDAREFLDVEMSDDLSLKQESCPSSPLQNVAVKKRKKEKVSSRDEVLQEFLDQERKSSETFQKYLNEQIQLQKQSLELQKSLVDLMKEKL